MQGCAVADTVIVDLLWPDIPLVVDDVEVCAGAAVVLTAQGSGYLNWFSDGVLLGVGPLLDLGVPVDSLLITVDQVQYGCTTTVQVQVSVTPMPMQASLVGPTTACLGEPFTLELVGGPGITGTWTGPQGSSWSGPVWSVPAASSADSGVYEVLPAIGPCVGDTLMWTLAVVEAQPMDLGPDTTICLGLFVTLTAPPWAASPIWSTGSTATAIIVGAAGVYSLEALDANGCTVWDDMEVFTIECEGEPPTVFSPNGDGINDHWHLIGVGGQQVEVRILDRFGAVVHEGVLGRMGWDGTHFRTGTPVPDGTYFYIVEQRRESGEPIARTGHITLLR
jgi:gliding motility-associated-like protein